MLVKNNHSDTIHVKKNSTCTFCGWYYPYGSVSVVGNQFNCSKCDIAIKTLGDEPEDYGLEYNKITKANYIPNQKGFWTKDGKWFDMS